MIGTNGGWPFLADTKGVSTSWLFFLGVDGDRVAVLDQRDVVAPLGLGGNVAHHKADAACGVTDVPRQSVHIRRVAQSKTTPCRIRPEPPLPDSESQP